MKILGESPFSSNKLTKKRISQKTLNREEEEAVVADAKMGHEQETRGQVK